MAIEYIGGITLKAPQHIEDKLAALAAKATQGKWTHRQDSDYDWGNEADILVDDEGYDIIREESGCESVAHDMRHIAALHNAAPTLLAVVRAARALTTAQEPEQSAVAYGAMVNALAALDAVEV